MISVHGTTDNSPVTHNVMRIEIILLSSQGLIFFDESQIVINFRMKVELALSALFKAPDNELLRTIYLVSYNKEL